MIGVFVQARLNSKRLPKKMLRPMGFTGNILTQSLRAARQIPADVYAVLTTEKDAHIIGELAFRENFIVIPGPEDDVLKRFVYALQLHEVDYVVRVTGDKVIISKEHMEQIIKETEYGYDLICYNKDPIRSVTCGAFKASTLIREHAICQDPYKREHIKPIINEKDHNIQVLPVSKELAKYPYDFSIDTIEDYARMVQLFESGQKNNNPVKFKYALQWAVENRIFD